MRKDVRRDQCMASGILLGRLACGAAALGRAVLEPDPWTAAFTVSTAARPMVSAFRALERSLQGKRPEIRAYSALVESLSDASGSSLNRARVSEVQTQILMGLVELGKKTLESCGKRRASDEDARDVLRTRRPPRKELS